MTTIAEVKTLFENQLQAIFLLDQTLSAERSALKRKAFAENRQLTADEITRRKEISGTRGELAEAMKALALDTVDALENSSDIDALLIDIETVNQQLKDDLDRLKKIEENAAKVEAVAKGLASVTDKLLDLKNTFV